MDETGVHNHVSKIDLMDLEMWKFSAGFIARRKVSSHIMSLDKGTKLTKMFFVWAIIRPKQMQMDYIKIAAFSLPLMLTFGKGTAVSLEAIRECETSWARYVVWRFSALRIPGWLTWPRFFYQLIEKDIVPLARYLYCCNLALFAYVRREKVRPCLAEHSRSHGFCFKLYHILHLSG